MQDTYWKQFMMSGKIEDYLAYKNSGADNREEETHCGQNVTEKQLHESDDRETRAPGH